MAAPPPADPRRKKTPPEPPPARKASRLPGNQPAVQVNPYSSQWLRRGFPWVYDAEIEATSTPPPRPGMAVHILDRDHALLGVGLLDQGRIAVRRFREDDGPIDRALLDARVAAAWQRRAPFLPPDTDAWRLIHGENDDLPGIRVEVFGPAAVLTLDSPALVSLARPLAEVLRDQPALGVRSVWLHGRTLPGEEAATAPATLPRGLLLGDGPEDAELVVRELGLRYRVLPAAGHDIGLFCDMREARAWMAPHWRGRRVLNLFCFTAAFSVSAAVHGAREVVSVDLSGPILQRAAANFAENGLDVSAHPLLEEDVFRALDRLRRRAELFDVVIADPPSFSHGPGGVWSVEKEYRRLVAACLRVLRPGGWLIAATNLGAISPREFKGYLTEGAERAGRRLRLIQDVCTPVDFPAALHFPESRYLKCWVMEG